MQAHRVTLRLADKSEWIRIFDPRDQTVFVATPSPPQMGEQLRLDISIGDTGPRVILRGKVISRHEAPHGASTGCNVELGNYEREKIAYLNGFFRGGLLNLREDRRIPVRLPVHFSGATGPQSTFTRDINEVGIFVISEEPLPEDSAVHLLITFPWRTTPTSLAGVVSHTVVVEDEDVPGMGIIFQFEEGQRDGFIRDIDKLEEQFRCGDLPEDALL